MRAYEEVIEFIADEISPDNLIAFQPSPDVKERVAELIDKEKASGLTLEEKSELDHYLQLEHIMRLLKARAHRRVSNEQIYH